MKRHSWYFVPLRLDIYIYIYIFFFLNTKYFNIYTQRKSGESFFFFFWILSILTYTHKGKVEKVLVIHCPMFIPPLVYILYLNRESWSFETLNKKKYQKKQRECQQYLSICILMGLLYEYEFVKRSVCSLIINLWTNFYLFIWVTKSFFFFFFFFFF